MKPPVDNLSNRNAIARALKASFPGTQFRVQKKAKQLWIEWGYGPGTTAVLAVVGKYESNDYQLVAIRSETCPHCPQYGDMFAPEPGAVQCYICHPQLYGLG